MRKMLNLSRVISFRRFGSEVRRELRRRPLWRIYRKYRNYTMVPGERYVNNLELALRYKAVDGCVVECGTWRGGMSAGLAEVLGSNREYFLFDSFEGLPPASELDGRIAADWQRPENRRFNFNNCSASIAEAEAAMRMSGVPRYHLVKGWFRDTLPNFTPPNKIAVLRLDGDWYESTLTCLESLYRYLAELAVVIVDDYHAWEGCSRAVNEFLARTQNSSNFLNISQFRDDVCYFERRSSPPWRPEVEAVQSPQYK